MAGNTRGKIKEQLEGIHRDFDWTQRHIAVILELIKEHNPDLSGSFRSLNDAIIELDNLAMGLYAKI